jgi:hypothetical protein
LAAIEAGNASGMLRRGRGPSLLTIIYVIVGIVVAAENDYLKNIDDIEAVISLLLAIVLWPLVLLDVNLHINDSPKKK